MEEPYDTPDPEFIKGFNEGYLMAKHLPDLAERLGKSIGDSARSGGFQAGQKQLALDQERRRVPLWSRPNYPAQDPAPDSPSPQMDDREVSPEPDREPER